MRLRCRHCGAGRIVWLLLCARCAERQIVSIDWDAELAKATTHSGHRAVNEWTEHDDGTRQWGR